MPKKKNTRNAGRKKTRDWTPVKIGPFDVHPDVAKDFEHICKKAGNSKVGMFRKMVMVFSDSLDPLERTGRTTKI